MAISLFQQNPEEGREKKKDSFVRVVTTAIGERGRDFEEKEGQTGHIIATSEYPNHSWFHCWSYVEQICV